MKTLKYFVMSFVTVVLLCLAAAAEAPEFTAGANVKTDGNYGIRVSAVISAGTAKDKNTIEYGFIVTRKVFLDAKELTAEDFALDAPVGFVKGIAKGTFNGESVDIYTKKTSSKVYFSCCISGIVPYHYTDTIVVRPYVISSDGKAYGTPLETSLYGAAKAILDDADVFDSLTQSQKDGVNQIISDTKYCVTFIADGKLHHREEVAVGGSISTLPVSPEPPEGMSFAGWSLSKDGDIDNMINPAEVVAEEHTRIYAVIVTEFIEKLHRGWLQLDTIRATGLQKDALEKIKECIGYVLEDAKKGIETDKDYVKEHYTQYVDDVKQIVNEEMTKTQRSQFANTITSRVDQDVRDFLTHYFDIDISV